MQKKKIIIFMLVMIFLIVLFIFMNINKSILLENLDIKTEKEGENSLLQSQEENGLSTINGDKALISSASIVERKTGTDNFDENDEPGNDSSETNNIVRSFDIVKYKIESTMKIKDGETITNLQGGYINIEVSLPEYCANSIEWQINEMAWAKDTAQISEDNRVFTAKYHMDEGKITVPGKQELEVIFKVLAIKNGEEFIPEFKIWLEGNNEEEFYSITDVEKIRVSASPKYNIKLDQNKYLSQKMTVNDDGTSKLGRMYGFGALLQLYNDNEEKGMKGIEIPKGDIKFDIDLNLKRGTEDITEQCTPILWNYKINDNGKNEGILDNRSMLLVTSAGRNAREIMPLGMKTANREESIYNSGIVNMIQNGNKITTTISDYEFDGIFPKYNFIWSGFDHNNTEINYSDNIGCFSSIYFQIFIPDNEASTVEGKNYYLTVSNTNFEAQNLSGNKITEQKNILDDSLDVRHYISYLGICSQTMNLANSSGSTLYTNYLLSDGYAYKGQNIVLITRFGIDVKSDYDYYTANKLIKFDGNAVEPLLWEDGSKYKTNGYDGDMEFNVWYLCKKDGTNWNDQHEMNFTNITDLDFYENFEDIPDDKLCIGIFLESKDEKEEGKGYLARSSGGLNQIQTPLVVKDTATIGQTYGFVQRTWMWKEKIDRETYSVINDKNIDNYPKPKFDSKNYEYIKTEYDENGRICLTDENAYNARSSDTLLIVGANQSVKVDAINENKTKSTYDLGQNENEVTYKIEPRISKFAETDSVINNISVKITDTLPKELRYVPGSEKEGREPEVSVNSDNTQTLTWNLYNCTVGEEITPIIFNASINEETKNSTKLKSTVVISADKDKIGNARPDRRTATNTIEIINLASHRLYKTTDKPIVEKNEEIHYQINYQNKTDSSIDKFQLLDILPYNGDLRGTNYSGNYKLKNINITQQKISSNEIIDNSNLSLYITNAEDARTNITAKDNDLGITEIWTQKEIGENIQENATAYVIKGRLEAGEKVLIDLYLSTEENAPKDKYVNSVTAQIYENTEEIVTNTVKVEVVGRKIDGKVWFDKNSNGIIDEQDEYLNNIEVTLLNEDNTTAYDIDGNEILPVITNEYGYYNFENMQKGNYKVRVKIDDKYEITDKNIGSNQEINNKFNENYETDILTKLNSVESPDLEINNLNAGIRLKDTSVLVHYYLEGTTNSIVEDKIISGKIDDNYETQLPDNIPNKYELVQTPENANGVMTKDIITVIYYFRIKDTSVLVKHLEMGTNNVLAQEEIINGKVDQEYQTSKSEDVSSKYELVEIPSNADGNMTEEQIVVIYYYQLKDSRVIVKYVDKSTNEELYDSKIINGKVDSNYQTEAQPIENYTCVENSNNTSGVMTEDEITVIYYYLKNTNVTVQYIDKITNQKISTDTVIRGVIGDDYSTNGKNITDYILVEEPTEKSGKMSSEEIVLTYYYKHVSEGVLEKHIDIITNEILDNNTISGKEGDSYSIPSKTFVGYDLVETQLPQNAEGFMTKDLIEVKYYYIKKAKVVAQYIDKITGEKICSDEVQNGHQNDEYITETKEFPRYDLINIPENKEGIMNEDEIDVIYQYVHKSAGVVERHIDITTNEDLVEEIKYEGHQGDNYETYQKVFEGYDIVKEKLPSNAKGKMNIDPIEVIYYYKRKAEVEVKFIDKTTGNEIKVKEVKGYEGDPYEIQAEEFADYDLIKEELPDNEKGTMGKEKIVVKYYYIKKAKVITKYIDNTTGKEIEKEEFIEGHEGDDYKATEKEIKYYKLIRKPDNSEGKMYDTITVKYYYEPLKFNLKLDKRITKISLNQTDKIFLNGKLDKIELNKKNLNNDNVKVEYLITVKNDGEIKGKAIIKEQIPDGFEMNIEDNKQWKISNQFAQLETEEINPNEEKTYKVVLKWINSQSNTGTKENIAYISEIENEANYSETSNEDNKDSASLIISIETGAEKNIKIILITLVAILIVGFVLYILKKKK